MSWQTDALAEQDMAEALWEMGEAEWRDIYCNEQPWYNKTTAERLAVAGRMS